MLVVAALAACGSFDDYDEPQVPCEAVFDAGQPQYRWPPPIEEQPRFQALFRDAGMGQPP